MLKPVLSCVKKMKALVYINVSDKFTFKEDLKTVIAKFRFYEPHFILSYLSCFFFVHEASVWSGELVVKFSKKHFQQMTV